MVVVNEQAGDVREYGRVIVDSQKAYCAVPRDRDGDGSREMDWSVRITSLDGGSRLTYERTEGRPEVESTTRPIKETSFALSSAF